MKCDFGGEGFVAVADNGGDTGDGGQLFRSALGVATGCDDTCCGVKAVGAADVGARFAIGFSGYAAGIDDDHVGFCWLALVDVRDAEKRGDGFAVSAGSTATEVLDVEGKRHDSSLAGCGLSGANGALRFVLSHPCNKNKYHCKDGHPRSLAELSR